MKKWLGLLMAAMLLSVALFAAQAEENGPQPGDRLNGFVVTETGRFELVGADTVLYEHEKTGAQVLLLANDDTNRVFDISFRTPALDEKGVSHVFEHATLSGSEKYPSKALFMNLSYQTYNTYMNAATYNNMTTFPVASLSEEQLLKYADFYTDSCFNPMIYTDESIFETEAWRYTLTDAEGELGLAGTVYSEMQGSYTQNEAAVFNLYKTLFPGSVCGNEFGGVPSEIPLMTWEDLKAYHAAYYHPSNSLTCLYGRFDDVDAFLTLLDGYFSRYEKKEIVIEDSGWTPASGFTEQVWDFPSDRYSNVSRDSTAFYGFACGGEDYDDLYPLSILLNDEGSVFMKRMDDEMPYAQAGCDLDVSTPEPCLYFYADGIDTDEKDRFRTIVEEALAQTAREGFDPDTTEAIAASVELDALLSGEGSATGVSVTSALAYDWACTGDVHGYEKYVDGMMRFAETAASGRLTEVIERRMLPDSTVSALAVTEPKPGLQEEQQAAQAERLAEIKAAMTDEEIAIIVEQTNAGPEQDDAGAYVRQLQAVTVESLPEEIRIYDIADAADEAGVRHLDVSANVESVGIASALLDAGGFTFDQLHDFKLYTDLLGTLDTSLHTKAQLSALLTRYFYGGEIRPSLMDTDEERGVALYLRATFIALDADLEEGYRLMNEILFETRFDDAEAVAGQVDAVIFAMQEEIAEAPYELSLYRAVGTGSKSSALFDYMYYLTYYEYLKETAYRLKTEPEAVLDALRAVQTALKNRTNAISCYVGSEESAACHRAAADAFFAALPCEPVEHQTYDIPAPAAAEAFEVGGTVQYNLLYASLDRLGLEEYDGGLDAVTALVTDRYLLPMLRDRYGVYGVFHDADDEGMYVLSYYDPNLAETFDVYAGLPDAVKSIAAGLDQETLDGYIMSYYSNYALSVGELTGGQSAVMNYISGDAQEEALEIMRELKGVTPESVAAWAPVYERLTENGLVSTVGSTAAIDANAAMFDNVFSPFSITDAEKVALSDVKPGTWYYDAVRFCFENRYMDALDGVVFGPDEPVDAGTAALGLYWMGVGATENPAAAIAELGDYGIMPGTLSPDAAVSREELADWFAAFCLACGAEIEDVPLPDDCPDAGEADARTAGVLGWCVREGFIAADEDGSLRPAEAATRGDLAYALYTLYNY